MWYVRDCIVLVIIRFIIRSNIRHLVVFQTVKYKLFYHLLMIVMQTEFMTGFIYAEGGL